MILWRLTLWCHSYREVWLHGVIPTEKSDSMVSFLLWTLTPWCHSYREVWLHSVIPTGNSDSMVSFLLCSLTLLCHSYRGFWLCGLISNAEFFEKFCLFESVVPLTSPVLILRCEWHCGVFYLIFKFWLWCHAYCTVYSRLLHLS